MMIVNTRVQQRRLAREEQYIFTVLFEPNELGGYTVTVPALPGVITEGRTLEEARQMAEEAIRLHLQALQEDGEPIPDECFLTGRVTVRLSALPTAKP